MKATPLDCQTTDLGAESQQSWQPWTTGDSLTSPAGILQTGLGAFVHIEIWVIPSEDGIAVEKHLGKASFYFPLLEICNQTRILKAKESCLIFFSVEFVKSVCSSTPIFSPKEHIVTKKETINHLLWPPERQTEPPVSSHMVWLFVTATGPSSFQGTWDWLVFKDC